MTTPAENVRTPIEILDLTRRIFAATHWTTGTYTGQRAKEDGSAYKAIACSVGGLRYAAAAPMENALDEAWMLANINDLGSEVPFGADDDPAAESYLAALEAMLAEIDPTTVAYYEDVYEGEGIFKKIDYCENVIVGWNDSYEDEYGSPEPGALHETILPTFDRAIETLKAKEAQA